MKEKILFHAVEIFIKQCPPEKIGPLTVSDIARKFNINLSYLSRSFKKYAPHRYTLHKFLEYCKITCFCRIAAKMEKPKVKDALALMNIKNINYFIRRYKKWYYSTPGRFCKMAIEYRRESGKDLVINMRF